MCESALALPLVPLKRAVVAQPEELNRAFGPAYGPAYKSRFPYGANELNPGQSVFWPNIKAVFVTII